MFQKSHYEFLASWLRHLCLPQCMLDIVLRSLTYWLHEDNPSFDPVRFRKAVMDG